MNKSILASTIFVVTAAFCGAPAALAQAPSEAGNASTLKCSDLAGLSADESHDLILYLTGYQEGFKQGQIAMPTDQAETAPPPSTEAAPAEGAAPTAGVSPAEGAAPAEPSPDAATPAAAGSKLGDMVGLSLDPQTIITACGTTPDTILGDAITSNGGAAGMSTTTP
ncbi:MAG: hypothetical protein JWQ89_3283 [Devosia sp.]|uniref:HdeA/HdeB family chaperone n=1 Tax=Devosia sp. TaxID=1871048 RepID=UPI0026125CD1|nr:HdeA/HdeB family chaperone [Devosia sp.]MDB5541556.1 hypothetical protein [Devosia sp.]